MKFVFYIYILMFLLAASISAHLLESTTHDIKEDVLDDIPPTDFASRKKTRDHLLATRLLATAALGEIQEKNTELESLRSKIRELESQENQNEELENLRNKNRELEAKRNERKDEILQNLLTNREYPFSTGFIETVKALSANQKKLTFMFEANNAQCLEIENLKKIVVESQGYEQTISILKSQVEETSKSRENALQELKTITESREQEKQCLKRAQQENENHKLDNKKLKGDLEVEREQSTKYLKDIEAGSAAMDKLRLEIQKEQDINRANKAKMEAMDSVLHGKAVNFKP
jgi:hypothetical protein